MIDMLNGFEIHVDILVIYSTSTTGYNFIKGRLHLQGPIYKFIISILCNFCLVTQVPLIGPTSVPLVAVSTSPAPPAQAAGMCVCNIHQTSPRYLIIGH